jgi:hypothetical protein
MGLRSLLSRVCRWFRSAPVVAPRRAAPRLETLEARDVPAVSLNDTYLAGLYQGLLGRAIDIQGLAFWRQQLIATNSPGIVADEIMHSQEFRGRELQILYPILLNRPLDTAGLNFWGNILESGGTYEQVKAGILGSQEYFVHNGNRLPDWLTAVYNSQLGRAPNPNDIAFWGSQFNSQVPLATMASEILASHEFHIVEMNSVYQLTLTRSLDPAGAAFWGPILDSGVSINSVIPQVLASPEYQRRLLVFINNNPGFNDPNQAANNWFGLTGQFNRLLPGIEHLDSNIATNSSIRTSLTTVTIPPAFTASPTAVTINPITGAPMISGTTAAGTVFTSPLTTGANSGQITGANSGTLTGTNSTTLTGLNSGQLTGTNSTTLTGLNSTTLTGANSGQITGANSGTLTGTNSTTLTGLNSSPGSFFV